MAKEVAKKPAEKVEPKIVNHSEVIASLMNKIKRLQWEQKKPIESVQKIQHLVKRHLDLTIDIGDAQIIIRLMKEKGYVKIIEQNPLFCISNGGFHKNEFIIDTKNPPAKKRIRKKPLPK